MEDPALAWEFRYLVGGIFRIHGDPQFAILGEGYPGLVFIDHRLFQAGWNMDEPRGFLPKTESFLDGFDPERLLRGIADLKRLMTRRRGAANACRRDGSAAET